MMNQFTPLTVASIRHAVGLAVSYWPNAHLGEQTRRDDLRSAFQFIRNRINRGINIEAAISDLELDAYRHADM